MSCSYVNSVLSVLMQTEKKISIEIYDRIADISSIDWNACAGLDNPFVQHAFLNALETSGSVTPETGWLAQHVLVKDEEGIPTACAPLYLKNHSYGEYIFDWGWADAFQRAGGAYYPKLQAAIPFTPATGPRLLVKQGASDEYFEILVSAMLKIAKQHGVSSLHLTFLTKEEWKRLGNLSFMQRTSSQFHWENKNYRDFDDFLDSLISRKRKSIKKERRRVYEEDIELFCLTGDKLSEEKWDIFYGYYTDTIDRKWGRSYLTRDFFSILGETMSNLAMLVLAEHNNTPVAGALNFLGSETIFGRNWGCSQDFKFLHFEACYYQAIEYAINNKLKWVEAGAQGPHKIQRGYLPREVYSAHWIKNDSLSAAIEGFLERERKEVDYQISELMRYSPFRSD
jgi:uncharacterized protein